MNAQMSHRQPSPAQPRHAPYSGRLPCWSVLGQTLDLSVQLPTAFSLGGFKENALVYILYFTRLTVMATSFLIWGPLAGAADAPRVSTVRQASDPLLCVPVFTHSSRKPGRVGPSPHLTDAGTEAPPGLPAASCRVLVLGLPVFGSRALLPGPMTTRPQPSPV